MEKSIASALLDMEEAKKRRVETDKEREKVVEDFLTDTYTNRVLFLDLETTGLPARRGYDVYYNYTNSKKYDTSRVVQMSWIICDREGKVVVERDYVIKPNGFTIPDEAAKIHGITTKTANEKGIKFSDAVAQLVTDTDKITSFVAHNLLFDKNVLYAELYRNGYSDVIKRFENVAHICTGEESKPLLKLRGFYSDYKMPRLEELYFWCFQKEMKSAHNSLYDTRNLKDCFYYMLDYQKKQKETKKDKTVVAKNEISSS